MKHNFYTDADANRPAQICDRNGQVVLRLCKACNKAEGELTDECAPQPAQPTSAQIYCAWDEAGSPCDLNLFTSIVRAALSEFAQPIPPAQPAQLAQPASTIASLLERVKLETQNQTQELYATSGALVRSRDCLKHIYYFLQSVCPKGIADDAFSVVPDSLFPFADRHDIKGVKHGN